MRDETQDTPGTDRKSDEEWRSALTPEQYRVLRQHATEPPWSHPYITEHRAGCYLCAGCGAPLFAADAKFDSGSGWPSYVEAFDSAIETTVDRSYGTARVEMHCRCCGGHLGHIFDDGPTPTGKRYCTNGTSLKFEPAREDGQGEP